MVAQGTPSWAFVVSEGRHEALPLREIKSRPSGRFDRPYPPAMAATIRYGSAPVETAWGRGASAGSCERSSPQAKNLMNGRRFFVT